MHTANYIPDIHLIDLTRSQDFTNPVHHIATLKSLVI